MPGNATITEASGQPQVDTDADYTIAFVGYSSLAPVAAGRLSVAYTNPSAAAADLGQGDAVDALLQAITVTPGNPAPPPAIFYRTPPTTPGSYNAINTNGVSGTAVVTTDALVVPSGTVQPYMAILVGGIVGQAGMTAFASLDNGRTGQTVQLGTADRYSFPSSDGWDRGGGQAGFSFGLASYSATYTALNAGRTAMLAHFIDVTSSTHLAADTTDNTALTAIPTATTPATGVTLFNAMRTLLGTHGANLTYHTIADTALATALALIPAATEIEDVVLNLPALRLTYEAHRVLTTGAVHGAADTTNTWASFSLSPATLNAGDVFFSSTNPPMWGDADLYAAGPPATGAFAALAESSIQVAIICITEPVAASDASTLIAGLNYGLSIGKRWSLIIRFRDPLAAGESDSAYIAAFQTFRSAFTSDSRITCLAGSGWLTDAFTGRVYQRTFLAAYLARLQSFKVTKGQKGEGLAQNPGWVARGPLEGFSVRDGAGNPVGHDELVRGGIDAANGAPTGGGVSCCYRPQAAVAGTYVSNRSTVMYPILSAILTPMDRRVANALETAAVGVSLLAIGGADVLSDPTAPPVQLDQDIGDGLANGIAKAIRDGYSTEFQNAADPNLAVINSTVAVVGAQVGVSGTVNARLYGYTDNVALTFSATR